MALQVLMIGPIFGLLLTLYAPNTSTNTNTSTGFMAQSDSKRGKILFNRCKACHSIEATKTQRMGPHLAGLFGRKAGSLEGFRYSAALQNATFTWTPEKLDQWLEQPNAFLPGNRMNFMGLKAKQDRQDLIAYIKEVTNKTTNETR